MRTRSKSLLVLASVALICSCSSNAAELPDAGAWGWPECEDPQVPFGDQCVDPGGLSPCELLDANGGCPPGYHCEDGRGCVEGEVCGDVTCQPGERCLDGVCTCADDDPSSPDAPCPEGLICAVITGACRVDDGTTPDCTLPCDAGEICVRTAPHSACVPPTYDDDGDGVPVGDVDGDGLRDDCDDLDPEAGPSGVEVCDGTDNDCDGEMDEGFDADGDGYTTCGYAGPGCDPTDPECADSMIYGPDCNDSDASVNPGAVDLCRLGPDGVLVNHDCDDASDSCPFGSQCCTGIEGCVNITSDPENCGGCAGGDPARICNDLQYCVAGECSDIIGEYEDVELPEVFDAEPGPANHPDVAWNWMRQSSWFSWSWEHDDHWYTSWYQHFWWELGFGIAWVQRLPGDRGVLLFDGRHFVSNPVGADSHVVDDVAGFMGSLFHGWYGTNIVAFLDGEDTIPCLVPGGGMSYGLAWSDSGGGGTQVFFAAIGDRGFSGLGGWRQQITHGSGEHIYPRLSYGPYFYYLGSNYGLVYQGGDDEDAQIYFQQVQGHWDWWYPFDIAWQVSDDEEGSLSPDIAWSPYGHGIVYVGASDSNLYYTLVSPIGSPLVHPVAITTEGNVAAWRASIVWNEADGEFGIAYQATSPPTDNQDIYFIRIGIHGERFGGPVRLTSDPSFQRHPDMAWTGDGYGITWYDNRYRLDEIAFAFVSAEGELLEGPRMLTDHAATGGNATNPAITHASVSDAIGGSTYDLFGWSAGADSLVGGGEFGLVWRDEATAGVDPRVHFMRMARER